MWKLHFMPFPFFCTNKNSLSFVTSKAIDTVFGRSKFYSIVAEFPKKKKMLKGNWKKITKSVGWFKMIPANVLILKIVCVFFSSCCVLHKIHNKHGILLFIAPAFLFDGPFTFIVLQIRGVANRKCNLHKGFFFCILCKSFVVAAVVDCAFIAIFSVKVSDAEMFVLVS